MAVGVALLPYAVSYPAMLIGVGLVAAASGLLIPALAWYIRFIGPVTTRTWRFTGQRKMA